MAGTTFVLNQRLRHDDPLISENIRNFINRSTLWSFTPEARHQIALYEEKLYNLKKERQAILRRESELIYLLHDLILQEKYMQLRMEQQDLMAVSDDVKTNEQRERELVIKTGITKILERRDIMYKDMDIEKLREQEEDEERFEEFLKMQQEWEEMKMPGLSNEVSTVSESEIQNISSTSTEKKNTGKHKDCIIL